MVELKCIFKFAKSSFSDTRFWGVVYLFPHFVMSFYEKDWFMTYSGFKYTSTCLILHLVIMIGLDYLSIGIEIGIITSLIFRSRDYMDPY